MTKTIGLQRSEPQSASANFADATGKTFESARALSRFSPRPPAIHTCVLRDVTSLLRCRKMFTYKHKPVDGRFRQGHSTDEHAGVLARTNDSWHHRSGDLKGKTERGSVEGPEGCVGAVVDGSCIPTLGVAWLI